MVLLLRETCFCSPYSVFVFCSLRLLQSKPQAARKALSENSLLKNIDFNEKFLGEESITESKMSKNLVQIDLSLNNIESNNL